MNFKAKSEFSIELSDFISQNPEKFLSIETIRNGIHDLKTDSGIYSFERILTTGLNHHVFLELNDFKIESIPLRESISVIEDNISKNEKNKVIAPDMIMAITEYLHQSED